MNWTGLRDNPLLAALFGTALPGLGHLYLRRWRRALGWLAALVAVSMVLVPAPTLDALAAGAPVDTLSVLPLAFVSAASVLDAIVLAWRGGAQSTDSGTDADDTAEPACPACGESVDPELGFCHWCTARFDRGPGGSLIRREEGED